MSSFNEYLMPWLPFPKVNGRVAGSCGAVLLPREIDGMRGIGTDEAQS
jgi:hypothetical protein